MLHDDKSFFEQIVLKVSAVKGIDAAIVEKDYFVTLFLKELSHRIPNIIFKGGTSLSKCFGLIERFSEDVDLNLISNKSNSPTESERKVLKEAIEGTSDSLGFTLLNPESIDSKKRFNRFVFDFGSIFESGYLKSNLVVEVATSIPSYPVQEAPLTSFLGQFLASLEGDNDLFHDFLRPVFINVQAPVRTLIDKIFAICDYYISNDIIEHSRHIYDIYKLISSIDMNSVFFEIYEKVRVDRQKNKTCLSAMNGVDMISLLSKIVTSQIFKNDYNSITESLLFERIDYNVAIRGIETVINGFRRYENS